MIGHFLSIVSALSPYSISLLRWPHLYCLSGRPLSHWLDSEIENQDASAQTLVVTIVYLLPKDLSGS